MRPVGRPASTDAMDVNPACRAASARSGERPSRLASVAPVPALAPASHARYGHRRRVQRLVAVPHDVVQIPAPYASERRCTMAKSTFGAVAVVVLGIFCAPARAQDRGVTLEVCNQGTDVSR